MNLLVMLAKEILENFLLPRKQKNFFRNYLTELYNNISDTDINTIISYIGITFRRFNSLLRGFWNYKKMEF